MEDGNSNSNFGILKEPPSSFWDLLKQVFRDPNLLILYAFTFVVALILPFLVTLISRKWREFRRKPFQKVELREEDKDPPIELPNGMTGSFNKSILQSIQGAFESRMSAEEKNPFLSRENVNIEEEEEDDNESKKQMAEGGEQKMDGAERNGYEHLDSGESPLSAQEKEKSEKRMNKPPKKFKDPDPETAEALNKLIEQGLHGKLATAQLRAKTHMLEEAMSDDERQKERQIQQEQLAKIFEMMEAQKEKFGISDKGDLDEQMKLYSI